MRQDEKTVKKDEVVNEEAEKELSQNELDAAAGGFYFKATINEKSKEPQTCRTSVRFTALCPNTGCRRKLINLSVTAAQRKGTCLNCNKIWVYNGQ